MQIFFRRLNKTILFSFLLITSCIGDDKELELKNLIESKYPNFEYEVQKAITEKYGENVFKNSKWEWKFEESLKVNEYKVKYGCFRDLNLAEDIGGELTQEITGALTFGVITYNPRSKDKGIFIELIVNQKTNSVKPKGS